MSGKQDDEQLGLPNQLRQLNLTHQLLGDRTNQPPAGLQILSEHDSDSRIQQSLGHLSGMPPDGTANMSVGPLHASGKKRPNQAQRRQMSSELSLAMGSHWNTPEKRSWKPSYNSQVRSQPRPVSLNQGMDHSNSLKSWQPKGDISSSNTRNASWNTASSSRPPIASEYSRSRPDSARNPNWPKYESLPAYMPRYTQPHHQTSHRQAFDHGAVHFQASLLDSLCYQVVSKSEIEREEIAQKEAFRQKIETICREVICTHESNGDKPCFPPSSIELKCFGSLASGFATKASDMDLGLFSPLSKTQPDSAGSHIPRLLERAFLDAGFGARLLSRTRVPIIKLCESPPDALRLALLAERSRWETGGINELENEPEHDGQDFAIQPESPDDVGESPTTFQPKSTVEFELPTHDQMGKTQRIQLIQNPKSSLEAYSALTKRVLRRAGGRDVLPSNYRDFTDIDWIILNRICQAYVQGLHDITLRQRLEMYPSLSFEHVRQTTGSANRSLAGVMTQVEGEQLVLRWNNWHAKAYIQDSNEQLQDALEAWTVLQQRDDFGDDPISYSKSLQFALDRIKRQPSIQLLNVEQGPQEASTTYRQRVRNIVRGLGTIDPDKSILAMKEIVLRYISGIYEDTVRDEISVMTKEAKHQLDLQEIGLKHTCFYLASELKRAYEGGLYDQSVMPDITKYINILRSPFSNVNNKGEANVPMTKELQLLLPTIARLRDPRKLNVRDSKDKYRDALEFPTGGVGVQCDINFSAYLALQNTTLLRCYSLTDPRVRPIVLFIKKWAKARGINSGYRGTLSSYGYVLMVLHYLVNVAQPFVCPNLQQLVPPPTNSPPFEMQDNTTYRGHDIRFWRNEQEIMSLAENQQLTHNTETLGQLLRGFFEYFAHNGLLSCGIGKGFDWGRDVLSLRTHGGLLSKQEKGWTGAKTVFECQEPTTSPSMNTTNTTNSTKLNLLNPEVAEVGPLTPNSTHRPAQGRKPGNLKEIRNRYLFSIEDPFETDHNVARTVTHNGIVSIRDEFRRAWRLIRTVDSRGWSEDLLDDITEANDDPKSLVKLLEEIHGPQDSWL